MSNRREFIVQLGLGGTVLASTCAMAQGAMVTDADPQAKALGYVPDATKTKNAKYVAGQNCTNCQLYQGKAGAAAGPCPLFAGKQVDAKGWCTAYAKKA